MKKLVILLLILVIGAGTYVLLKRPQPAPVVSVDSKSEESVKPVAQKLESDSFIPQKLIIKKIQVNASVEEVGLDAEKRMDVPKEDMNVGWYKYGPKLGDVGSSVIAGHFDTKIGGQAVFYRLSELKKGDEIIVLGKGSERTFVVTDVQIFKDESFPISLVFSQTDKRRLNLITCDGVFDNNQKNYSDRLVVFSEMREN